MAVVVDHEHARVRRHEQLNRVRPDESFPTGHDDAMTGLDWAPHVGSGVVAASTELITVSCRSRVAYAINPASACGIVATARRRSATVAATERLTPYPASAPTTTASVVPIPNGSVERIPTACDAE